MFIDIFNLVFTSVIEFVFVCQFCFSWNVRPPRTSIGVFMLVAFLRLVIMWQSDFVLSRKRILNVY